MYLKIGKSNGRIYLSIVNGYREKDTGKTKHKTRQLDPLVILMNYKNNMMIPSLTSLKLLKK